MLGTKNVPPIRWRGVSVYVLVQGHGLNKLLPCMYSALYMHAEIRVCTEPSCFTHTWSVRMQSQLLYLLCEKLSHLQSLLEAKVWCTVRHAVSSRVRQSATRDTMQLLGTEVICKSSQHHFTGGEVTE